MRSLNHICDNADKCPFSPCSHRTEHIKKDDGSCDDKPCDIVIKGGHPLRRKCIPYLGACTDCKKHKATVEFSEEPLFSLTHSYMGTHKICQCCYVKRVKEGFKDVQRNLRKQEKILKEKGCK